MSTPEFIAVHFISKLKVMVHQKWLREMNNEYNSFRSSSNDDEKLTDEIWINSPRPPLIKRQSGECNLPRAIATTAATIDTVNTVTM